MKLSLSNIAWPQSDEWAVAELMCSRGIRGVEIAPTMVFPDPVGVSDADLDDYRERWASRDIEVVALQALLFGHPEMQVFGDAKSQEATLDHLSAMARFGGRLGARALVFGSPKNRTRGELDPKLAFERGVDFFRRAAERCADHGTVLCIEPNPRAYDCDFITNAAEGLELVLTVGHAGLELHLDAAGMALAGDDPPAAIGRSGERLAHFHASEPWLGPLGEAPTRPLEEGGPLPPGSNHGGCAAGLESIVYDHWVSVEMRQVPERTTTAEIARVLDVLEGAYGTSE